MSVFSARRLYGNGRPTPESLAAIIQVNPPAELVNAFQALYDLTNGDLERLDDLVPRMMMVYPGGREHRYPTTPPELFPFGGTGVDGDHYGLLLTTPEIPVPSPPIASYCEIDGDGIVLRGANTREGLSTILNACHGFARDPALKAHIAELAILLNLPLGSYEPIESWQLPIPAGYHHVPTHDGVGAVAAKSAFLDEHPPLGSSATVEAFLKAARSATKKGKHGSALYYLREAMWYYSFDRPTELLSAIGRTYMELGRDILAAEVKQIHKR